MLLFFVLACSTEPEPSPVPTGPRLRAVGPRLVTNQTDVTLFVYGERLSDGLELRLGEHIVPLNVVDDALATAQLPEDITAAGNHSTTELVAQLVQDGAVLPTGRDTVTVVDDQGFPGFSDMAMVEEAVFVAIESQDALWRADTGERIAVGDGPSGLAVWEHDGKRVLVVAHRFDPALLVVDPTGGPQRSIELPVGGQGVVVREDRAYVTNLVDDALIEVDLVEGRLVRSLPVGVNPRHLVLARDHAIVANLGSSDLSIVDLAAGVAQRTQATPKTSIVGGPTERFQDRVIGGKAMRDLVWSEAHGVAFAATIGPNIGPNPERWEVAMNGGVSVIALSPEPNMVRHVSMQAGVAQALALDEQRGILYVASVSTGQIVAFDVAALARSDDDARKATLARLALTPPDDVTLMRPRPEWEQEHDPSRTGKEIHTGPAHLALSDDGSTLLVLSRFTGRIDRIDVSKARAGEMTVGEPLGTIEMGQQALRRQGETVYHTDLGRSQMSCDACHMEGHNEGLLFSKGKPIRLYRATSMRGQRDAAPYFTPARFPTMETALEIVLGRNRYGNPEPTRAEVTSVAAYTNLFAPLPSPWLDDGKLPDEITLPDGTTGRPAQGWRVFRDKACAECHPPPQYTLDDNPRTRGQLFDVGTPMALPIRPEMQDMERLPMAVPTLVGVWDNYPLLLSGSAGFSVEGDLVRATEPFALRAVVAHPGRASHGRLDDLTPEEENDLLAFLLTL